MSPLCLPLPTIISKKRGRKYLCRIYLLFVLYLLISLMHFIIALIRIVIMLFIKLLVTDCKLVLMKVFSYTIVKRDTHEVVHYFNLCLIDHLALNYLTLLKIITLLLNIIKINFIRTHSQLIRMYFCFVQYWSIWQFYLNN